MKCDFKHQFARELDSWQTLLPCAISQTDRNPEPIYKTRNVSNHIVYDVLTDTSRDDAVQIIVRPIARIDVKPIKSRFLGGTGSTNISTSNVLCQQTYTRGRNTNLTSVNRLNNYSNTVYIRSNGQHEGKNSTRQHINIHFSAVEISIEKKKICTECHFLFVFYTNTIDILCRTFNL